MFYICLGSCGVRSGKWKPIQLYSASFLEILLMLVYCKMKVWFHYLFSYLFTGLYQIILCYLWAKVLPLVLNILTQPCCWCSRNCRLDQTFSAFRAYAWKFYGRLEGRLEFNWKDLYTCSWICSSLETWNQKSQKEESFEWFIENFGKMWFIET